MEASFGGNSMKSTSGMNAALTPIQELNNVNDSYELFEEDTAKSGKGLSNDKLIRKLTQESTSAWQFLTTHGIDLS
jgi:succinate dehydrogenase/fumarate reductase flavoprotein subunit